MQSEKKNKKRKDAGGIQPFNRVNRTTRGRTKQRKQSNLIIIIRVGASQKGHDWQVEEKE